MTPASADRARVSAAMLANVAHLKAIGVDVRPLITQFVEDGLEPEAIIDAVAWMIDYYLPPPA